MKRSAVIFSLGMLLAACGGGGGGSGDNDRSSGPAPTLTPKAVSVAFKAVAGDEDIACGITYTLGSAETDVTLLDFRFYVHNLRLVTNTGEEVALTLEQNNWQNGNVAMLDFQNKASTCSGADKPLHTTITGTVPDGSKTFTGVRFTVGVPEDRNHLLNSEQPSPLNATGMFWSWRAGYKFMRLDVAPVGGGVRPDASTFTAWNIHLGSTNCTEVVPYVCANINRPQIALENFDPASNSIQLDYAVLVANSHLAEDAGGAAGCMSGTTDPECPEVFTALGLNLASGEPDPALVQTVFSVVP